MTGEHWGAIEALFHELVDLDEDCRATRLSEISGGDPDLAITLRRLLTAHDRSDELLAPLDELPALSVPRDVLRPEALSGIARTSPDPLGLIGRTVSGYEIVGLVGVGGMGVLYEAIDTRLSRRAALKFLPPRLGLDPSYKTRFLREARAAAALDHPNVCAIWEVGETPKGELFIAMPLYTGQTVAEMVTRGPLPVEEALDLAAQTARGLQVAHEAGLVHRDIKPANLMVTADGTLKILDFGVAKSEETVLTAVGTRLGTPAYMSPEQTRGEDVRPQTDHWALGVVLYEMLTGSRPFKGGDSASVIHSIRLETPEAPDGLREDVPSEVSDLVMELLAKKPGPRRRAARRLAGGSVLDAHPSTRIGRVGSRANGHRLRWQAVVGALAVLMLVAIAFSIRGPPEAPPPSGGTQDRMTLAVLPFESRGGGKADGILSGDQVHEQLITTLAKVGAIRVTSRTSVMGYRDATLPLPEVGRELGAAYLLQGWVEETGGRGQIHVELIHAATDERVWAATYPAWASVARLFAIQADIATRVARRLDAPLSPREREAIETPPTTNTEALGLYRRAGMTFGPASGLFSRAGLVEALRMYQGALALDSGFVEAKTGAATVMVELYWLDARQDDSLRAESRRLLDEALAERPDLPTVHYANGAYHYRVGNYRAAMQSLQRTQRLGAEWLDVDARLAMLYRRQGQPERSLTYWLRVAEKDPRSANRFMNLAFTYQILRRFDEARAAIEKAIELEADFPLAWRVGGDIVFELEGVEGAIRWLEEAPGEVTIDPMILLLLGQMEQRAGRHGQALRMFDLAGDLVVNQAGVTPVGVWRAHSLRALDDSSEAQAVLLGGASALEARLDSFPEDGATLSALGLIEVMLGREEQALEHTRRAVHLMPMERDYLDGAFRLEVLAAVYAWTGRGDDAVEVLETLLAEATTITVRRLREDWMWDPLRGHPAFESLIAPHGAG